MVSNRWFAGQTYTIDQPTQLAFTQPPTNTVAGSVINGSTGVQVAVEDSSGSMVSVDSSAVTLTLNGGTFASGGNTITVNAVNGVATFSNLVINTPGIYTLTAGDGTLTMSHIEQLHHYRSRGGEAWLHAAADQRQAGVAIKRCDRCGPGRLRQHRHHRYLQGHPDPQQRRLCLRLQHRHRRRGQRDRHVQ